MCHFFLQHNGVAKKTNNRRTLVAPTRDSRAAERQVNIRRRGVLIPSSWHECNNGQTLGLDLVFFLFRNGMFIKEKIDRSLSVISEKKKTELG